MKLLKNFNLKPYNSFRFDIVARFASMVDNLNDLVDSLQFAKEKKLSVIILGSGSNVILKNDFNGLVIIMLMQEIFISKKIEQHRLVTAGAGVNWDKFVTHTLDNCCYGLENLSYIPGTVGACPIQNVGAYGVEIKDYFQELEAFDRETLKVVRFDSTACEFSYRNSVFKNHLKDRYIILSVTFKLNAEPKVNTNDKNLFKELQYLNQTVTPYLIRESVITIRKRRLPDVDVLGNAGSFYINPIIEKSQAQAISDNYPDLISFPLENDKVKLSAGWLIDKCGWRGFEDIKKSVGVYKENPLVLVNLGHATANNIFDLSNKIRQSVFDKFSIQLQIEPLIYE